jgi:hypothetical protein
MKTILMTMTALAALAAAAPAAAQPWNGQRSQTGELQMQLDAGIRSGAITRREAMPLRSSLRELISLERQFSPNGFTGRENAALRQRSNLLSRQIRMAERDGYARDRGAGWDDRDDERRAGWEDRDDDRRGWDDRDGDRRTGWDGRDDRRDGYATDPRFDRPNRGDRFAGDARVGHPASLRMVALPAQYLDEFRDTADVYYRYDNRRIYRVNRRTDMILGLFDLPS